MELTEMIHKVHEAIEGRYSLTGYDLHMIHGTLCEITLHEPPPGTECVWCKKSPRYNKLVICKACFDAYER